ncbi:MAG: hypothetical protein PHT03_04805 [Bacilli bacterium]|nr:hypothetical protein [Bacilli bacterium]
MKVKILSDEIMALIQEMLHKGRVVELTISGVSMRPFYLHQATVVTLVAPQGKLKKYDVVLYRNHNKYKLHRIIGVKKGLLVICGDGLKEKEYIAPDAVFGKVIKHQTAGKIVNERSRWYLVKVFLWYLVYPIRRYLLRIFRKRVKDESDNQTIM